MASKLSKSVLLIFALCAGKAMAQSNSYESHTYPSCPAVESTNLGNQSFNKQTVLETLKKQSRLSPEDSSTKKGVVK